MKVRFCNRCQTESQMIFITCKRVTKKNCVVYMTCTTCEATYKYVLKRIRLCEDCPLGQVKALENKVRRRR